MTTYTSSSPYTTSASYQHLVNGDLSFSSINSYEVDYGNFTSFTDTAPAPLDVSSGSLLGIGWGGFLAGVSGANSSTTYTISYTVNATNAAEAITRLAQLYVVDADVGPGASATATEQAFDSAGNLVGTTTWSAATGASSSVTLAAGYQQLNIVLTVNESIGSAGLPASAVSLSVIDQYFGQTLVSQLASINSTVFCDANENGVQDSGETGMAGVTVELLNSTGTQILGTTTTNASGGYSFGNLQAGTYETQVIAPSGDLVTAANGGLDAGIALKAGQNDTVAPTGLYMPAVFDVHVYLDANDNGVQDSGDSNLSGVTVALLNGNGSPTGETATTDANGNVSFTGLAAGSYEVSVTTPSGDIVTQDTNVMTPVALASCGSANAIEGLYPATPGVSIVKSVVSVGGVSGDPAATYVGEVIDYNVVVTNTGNETLTNVVVTDPTLGTTLGTLATLAPGATETYTASQTVTQAELDSGNAVTNTATVSDDQTPSESSTVSTGVMQTPDVSIVKSVISVGGVSGDPAATYAGEAIDYNVVVTNTGNETLTNVVVTDPTLGTTLGTLASLAPGATMTYTASQTVTQAELDSGNAVTNTATVSDDQTPSESSTVSTGVMQTPDVSIVKSVISVGGVSGDQAATYAGEMIDYNVVVTNTGNETLTNVVVTDPTLGTTLGTLASLAPGATETYTASQTVTQAELDSGNAVINTATVSDDQTPSESSTVSTGVTQTPDVSIVKSVISVGGVSEDQAATYVGEAIDYNVVVTNTGNETLTDVVVTDPTLGTTLGTLASLAPGATETYTASQTVTQAELDSGNAVINTATVSDTQTPSELSTVSTEVTQTPAVSIVKSVISVGGVSGDPAATTAGEVIDYNVVITNIGNETLTNVVVTDPTLGTTLGTLASLAPGATTTYTASQTVTQAEINSGAAVTNTATVTDTQTPSESSTVSTGVTQAPGVSIVKSVISVGGVSGDQAATVAGEAIDYNVVVTNTGNETLTNVVVMDTTLGITLGTLASLAPGATTTYTASQTVTQAEINSGNAVINTATVSDTQTPSGSSTASTGVTQTPGVSIVKSVISVGGVSGDQAATVAGEAIDYNVVVTNTGNETLTNVVVRDPTLGITLGTLASLAPGATMTYTASQTITQAEINSGAAVTNTATVTDTQTPSKSSTASTTVTQTPGVSIVKSVTSVGGVSGDPAATTAGEVIDYNVVVTNTGNETLTNVVVTDTTLGTTLGTLASLAPGATMTYTATQTVTQAEINSGAAVTNTATVTDTQTPSKSSTASTTVTQTPSVSIVKSVTSVGGVSGDPAATYAGEAIDYNVVVTNTGNETLTNVVVTDPTLGTTLGTLASLAPGATATYTASQTVTQAEINSGAVVTNTATVTDTQTPSKSSTASTTVTQTPDVSIVKSVTSVGGVSGDPAATYAGEAIDYNVVVTNTGNETLTNVVVLDTTLGTTLGTLASLAPGATMTYTATQTVTQAEINSGAAVTNTATVTDTQTPSESSTASTAVSETAGITVIKLPSQVVVGTCGQVTYTFDVINTGSAALTNVQITDNIGTAANPDYISPVLQTQTTNGVLLPGQTWVYTATINQSGDFASKGGSQSCSVSGQDLGSGCTAWLNSSFTPTSCKNGATYTFQNISCTIRGPECGTITVQVPNACVTFSSSCTQATTTYNASENCWVTTLPANCSPGNVFLSGLPYAIPSGCNLSGATISWNIGGSANNCGSSSVSWQTGCAGYSSFQVNGCNGLSNYNQIGVQACDNPSGYGYGGYNNQSSGNNCAGTPANQYTGSNCGSGNPGGDNGGCGGSGNDNGGTCGNGGGSGSVSCGQLGDSSEADTVTVTATTLGSGFSLGDAGNYGVVAFAPNTFKGASGSLLYGNVGVGESYGTVSFKLGGDKITGNLVTTGAAPSAASTGGTMTGSITGNSSTLAADISALKALSLTLASETGTSEKLTSGMTINAMSGTLDSAGDYVFTVTQWANNITINGTGSNNVVLNFASGVTPTLDNVVLSGGLTANQVLFNDQNTGTITGTAGDTFNGTFLAPNAVFNVTGVTVDGHLYGGASGQTFSFTSGATLNTPANTSTGTPSVSTVTASDSTEVQVLSGNSPITENGNAPTGSLSSLYGTGEKLEFTYNPSNTVSLKQIQAGLASVTGSNSNAMAFLEITNNSNPHASGASIYFEGEVQTGENIFADATINQLTNTPIAAPNNHFSTTAGADIYAYVFNSQAAFQANAAPIQTMTYNTSGSQAMHIGDQIASLTVAGYVGTTGGHLVS